MVRKNQSVEVRMVAEYLMQRYAAFPRMTAVPLGAIPDKLAIENGMAKAIALSRPFRPECDAVVVLPNYLLLVEAKVWNVVNGLAKLPLYKSLVPVTPELKEYQPREVLMELVVGWTNPNLERMASDAGVKVVLYNPPWLADVVNGMHKYWTPEYRQLREEKLRLRTLLGIE